MLVALASTVIRGFGTHDDICILCRLLWGLRRQEGLNCSLLLFDLKRLVFHTSKPTSFLLLCSFCNQSQSLQYNAQIQYGARLLHITACAHTEVVNPTALGACKTGVYYSLLHVCSLHLFTCGSGTSFSTSCSHISPGQPLGSFSNIFLSPLV
jgi:hypothetical protein